MNPKPRAVLTDVGHFIAFGFGSGLSPIAPGTAGSIIAIPAFIALWNILPPSLLLPVIVVAFIVGIPICDRTGRWIGEADHKGIVWDEIVAMWAVLYCLPNTIKDIVIGFLAFRFLDIVKPWPIRIIDTRVKNGFGVMLDDLLAAIAAVGIISVFKYAYTTWF